MLKVLFWLAVIGFGYRWYTYRQALGERRKAQLEEEARHTAAVDVDHEEL